MCELGLVLFNIFEGDRDMGQSLAMTPSSVGRDPIQRGLDRLQRWLWDNLQRFNKTIARICTWKCRKT